MEEIYELKQKQSLPLEAKINMSTETIKYYPCDAERNKGCGKTNCRLTGGDCYQTANEEYAQKTTIAYVCSPFGGDIVRNKQYARYITRDAIKLGYTPVTPHLYITEVLDEHKPEERAKGLEMGLNLLRICDIMVVGDVYGVSPGMDEEIKLAKQLSIPIITHCNRYQQGEPWRGKEHE